MAYDDQNIFARILRNEIPARKIFEDDSVLAFHDAYPKAPVHVLIIPKGQYTDIHDFTSRASDAEIVALNRAISKVVTALKLEEKGFRAVANTGEHGGQEVPHFHVHILGGKTIGAMVAD